MEIWAEAAPFLEKEYISGIFVAVRDQFFVRNSWVHHTFEEFVINVIDTSDQK